MFVHVRLFAGAAQIVGATQIRLEVGRDDLAQANASSIDVANANLAPPTVQVGEVVRQLIIQFPNLAELAQASRWALGEEFVGLKVPVSAAQTLAMIPPVSGG